MSRIRLGFAVVLWVLPGCALWAAADPHAVGSEFPVPLNSDANAGPAVAVAPGGDFVLAWQRQGATTSGWDVWARKFHSDGTAFGAEFVVNTSTGGCERSPAVAIDAAGNFVVTWQSDLLGIRGRRFGTDTTPTSSEFAVSTSAGFTQQSPAIAMQPGGKFLVVWQSLGQDGDGWGIYGQNFTNDAMPLKVGVQEFRVNTTTAGSQHSPAVAYTVATNSNGMPLGRFTAVWQSEGQGGVASRAYLRMFDLNGSEVVGETAVPSSTTFATSQPAIGADPSGNFTIAWESLGQDGSGLGVYARRFHPGSPAYLPGTAFGPEFAVNTTTAGNQRRPAVAADAIGNVVIAWESDGQDGSGLGLYLRAFTNQGLQRGTVAEVPVNTTSAGDQRSAVVGLSAGGALVAAWQSEPLSGLPQVEAQRFQLTALNFYTLTPCRIADTRNATGPLGGPSLASGVVRNFPVAAVCAIPATARALSVNLTAVPGATGGGVTFYPGDAPVPNTSNLNYNASVGRANNAVVSLSRDGAQTLNALAFGGTVNFILDVNGYFQE